jgi:hypothetical protein
MYVLHAGQLDCGHVVLSSDLHRTDPAGSCRGKGWMVAKCRDVDAVGSGGLEHTLAFLGLDILAVDADGRHGRLSLEDSGF